MKAIHRFLFVAIAAVMAAACSSDEDAVTPQEALGELSFSIASAASEPIQLPAGIVSSSDEHAVVINGYAATINHIATYKAYFEPPTDAVKSSRQIKTKKGRANAANADYLVYTWTAQDKDIAYQISQQDGKNVFEVFTKTAGQSWIPLLSAEETAGGQQGQMRVYVDGDDALLEIYTWVRNGDLVNFKFTIQMYGDAVDTSITINTKSKEGSAELAAGSLKHYSMTWNTRGKGTWTKYNPDGSVAAGGAWDV